MRMDQEVEEAEEVCHTREAEEVAFQEQSTAVEQTHAALLLLAAHGEPWVEKELGRLEEARRTLRGLVPQGRLPHGWKWPTTS